MRKPFAVPFAAAGAAALVLSAAAPALAAVTFDPATGMGFSGKGDVQVPFGWDAKQMRANASGVSFSYVESTVKTQDCVDRYRGTIISRTEDVVKTTGVATAVTYDIRNNKQGDVNGFTLKGLGASSSVKSGGCAEGETPNGPAVEVSTTELLATHGTTSHAVWQDGTSAR